LYKILSPLPRQSDRRPCRQLSLQDRLFQKLVGNTPVHRPLSRAIDSHSEDPHICYRSKYSDRLSNQSLSCIHGFQQIEFFPVLEPASCLQKPLLICLWDLAESLWESMRKIPFIILFLQIRRPAPVHAFPCFQRLSHSRVLSVPLDK